MNIHTRKEEIIANPILERGPEAPTLTKSTRGLLKLRGLMGTGLAQPIMNGERERIKRRGNIIVPMGSICGRGFNVILPAYLAVLSPHREAIHAWAHSWITSAKKKITRATGREIIRKTRKGFLTI